MIGLVIGKVVGIVGAAALAVRFKVAVLPRRRGLRATSWPSAMLGGVGFTVSLLIADLSLDGAAAEQAKAAVLIASLAASLLAAVLLVAAQPCRTDVTTEGRDRRRVGCASACMAR